MNINLLKNLQNRDMLTNLFIFFIAISLMQFFDSKIIISITCVILIFVNFPKLQAVSDTTEDIKQDIKKYEISSDMHYNSTITDLLQQLKPFKKYNKVSYKEGVKYMRKFFKTVQILEKKNIYNRNQYFDLCKDYLKQSINHFQSMSVSMPEKSLQDSIKLGNFEVTQKTKQLSDILKQLHEQCYFILLNIGITFNEKWLEDPNIYTREIDLNTDRVEFYNKNEEYNWALY